MREIAGDGGSTEREDALRAAVERFEEQPAVAALGPAVAAVREAQRSADPTDTAGPDRVGMATGELARAYRRAHEAMREAGVERCGGLPSAADVPEEPPVSEPPELSTGGPATSRCGASSS